MKAVYKFGNNSVKFLFLYLVNLNYSRQEDLRNASDNVNIRVGKCVEKTKAWEETYEFYNAFIKTFIG